MKKKLPLFLFLIVYSIINLCFLTKYPFVHSDEPWISGLTRSIMDTGSIYSTESFFPLYPRYPHMIKLVFQMLQMPFLLLFGYNIFAVRLISMIFSILTLYFFHQIINCFLKNEKVSLLFTALFSVNIQYLYASHFARQEIIILFFMMCAFYYYIKPSDFQIKHSLVLGSIIGLSIGIHPNSFLIAMIFGCLYITDLFLKKKYIRDLLLLVSTVSIYALFFIFLSLLGDPEFFTHYSKYGETLGVSETLAEKAIALGSFYKKLFYGISGTYYTPDIALYLLVFCLMLITVLIVLFVQIKKGKRILHQEYILKCMVSIAAIHIGSVSIGRYNPTSVVFIFPFFYILFTLFLSGLVERYKKSMLVIISFFIILSAAASLHEILPYTQYDYNDYLEQLRTYIPDNKPTLGNLNAEFYYENGTLIDYRNLAFLDENHMSFDELMKAYSIEYIIYHEELDYINRNPKWNILYGEDGYYDDMNNFIEESCTLIGEFENPLYGGRIVRYMLDYPWKVWIYKVNP